MRPFGRHLHNQIIVPLVVASVVVAVVAMAIAVALVGRIIQSWIDEGAQSVIANTQSRLNTHHSQSPCPRIRFRPQV